MDCIIIEDESLAIEIIENYVGKASFLNLVGSYRNPLQALSVIIEKRPQLLLIDINMPDLSGIDLLDSLPYQPYVIFTTAYPDFALQSFDYKTIDYLLKPIKFSRFLKAVVKAKKFVQESKSLPAPNQLPPDSFFLKSGNEIHQVNYYDLLFVESSRNYVFYHTTRQKIALKKTITEVEKELPVANFQRVHKSFIVNLMRIETVKYDGLKIDGYTVPIGRSYREVLQERLVN